MSMSGTVMQMRPLAGIDIPAGQPVTLKPGSEHIMLIGLNHPLQEGQSFPLTLTFEKGGTRTVSVPMKKPAPRAPGQRLSIEEHARMAGKSPQRAAPAPSPGGAPRFLLVAAVLAGFVILGTGAFLALAFRDNPRGIAGTTLSSAIGGPFRLTDQNGKTVTDADLKGKWSLVYFGYTHCPDACPTALNDIAIALEELGSKRDAVRSVFITVDPERDTPAALKDYVTAFDAPILALTGTPEEVAQAAKAYRVYYAKHPESGGDYSMDHSSVIYVMDPAGPLRRQLHPREHPGTDLRKAEEAARLTGRRFGRVARSSSQPLS